MANQVMMKLGNFKFSILTAAYQKLTKTYGWNWAEVKRFNNTASLQYTGKNNPTRKLDGVVFPEFESVGVYQIDDLVELGDLGTPLLLVSGIGAVLGYWVITKITNTEDKHMEAGIPTKQVFSMEIKYYGDSI